MKVNIYESIVRPLLFCLPPETAHKLSMEVLRYYSNFINTSKDENRFPVKGINVKNRLGIAAGCDKNGEYIDALSVLGFGFVEVGTVTPRPQLGNQKPRLFRLSKEDALINCMGFNNNGVDCLVEKLKRVRSNICLGVNIGKNYDTPNANAVDDYLFCIERVFEYSSYIVVNISSPNTSGLRDLQNQDSLRPLVDDLKEKMLELSVRYSKSVPLFVKVSPDEDQEALESIVETLCEFDLEGVVVSNTTASIKIKRELGVPEVNGGVSGRPLRSISRDALKIIRRASGDKLCIIAVGGIDSVEEANYRLQLGADLVQLYSGLVYKGPQLVKNIGYLPEVNGYSAEYGNFPGMYSRSEKFCN